MRAWNLVTCPGSWRAKPAFDTTNLSRTSASTLTIAAPSAVCSGVASMLIFVRDGDVVVIIVALSLVEAFGCVYCWSELGPLGRFIAYLT